MQTVGNDDWNDQILTVFFKPMTDAMNSTRKILCTLFYACLVSRQLFRSNYCFCTFYVYGFIDVNRNLCLSHFRFTLSLFRVKSTIFRTDTVERMRIWKLHNKLLIVTYSIDFDILSNVSAGRENTRTQLWHWWNEWLLREHLYVRYNIADFGFSY